MNMVQFRDRPRSWFDKLTLSLFLRLTHGELVEP